MTILLTSVTASCGGDGGGDNPTGPSTPGATGSITSCTELMNCPTGDQRGVFIIVNPADLSNGGPAPFSYTFAGHAVSGPGGGRLTRQFVGLAAGTYELTGQAGNQVQLSFSNSRGFGATDVQILDGTESSRECKSITLGALGGGAQAFRLRVSLGPDERSQDCI